MEHHVSEIVGPAHAMIADSVNGCTVESWYFNSLVVGCTVGRISGLVGWYFYGSMERAGTETRGPFDLFTDWRGMRESPEAVEFLLKARELPFLARQRRHVVLVSPQSAPLVRRGESLDGALLEVHEQWDSFAAQLEEAFRPHARPLL